MTPRVLILRAPGTNCDAETAHAFALAGGATQILHLNQWLAQPRAADDHQILCIPGGFSYGDDIAAGRIYANQLRHHLRDALLSFVASGKLVLGICNGFQVLLQCSLFNPLGRAATPATLTWSDGGRFQDRWVSLRVEGDRCPFLRGIERLELPIANAEGKFVFADRGARDAMLEGGQLALRYDDSIPGPTALNPNGSELDVAGVCDASGRVFGLMPHPERFVHRTHHPQWTRRQATSEEGAGLALFRNAVEFFR